MKQVDQGEIEKRTKSLKILFILNLLNIGIKFNNYL